MAALTDPHVLGENRLLAALPQEEQQRLLPQLEAVRLTIKHRLYERNKPITHVYFVRSGVVSLVAIMDDESIVEVATTGNEGMIGLPVYFGAHTSPLEAFCQVPGEALRMEAGAFREALQADAALPALLQRYTLALFNQIAQSTACKHLHPTEVRCARWLLMTHDRVPGDRFPLTHEFLSQMLGVRRATVTVAAGMLQKAGMITYARGVITVLNRPGLEAVACECYRIIKEEYRRLLGEP
jgi:CRP-like cAMP-binding protein